MQEQPHHQEQLQELVQALELVGALRPDLLAEAIRAAQMGAPPAYVSRLLNALCANDIEIFANVVSSNLSNDETTRAELDHVLDASPERGSPLGVSQNIPVPGRRGVVAGQDKMLGSEGDEASFHRYFRGVPVN